METFVVILPQYGTDVIRAMYLFYANTPLMYVKMALHPSIYRYGKPNM